MYVCMHVCVYVCMHSNNVIVFTTCTSQRREIIAELLEENPQDTSSSLDDVIDLLAETTNGR
jgi:hypothetical protein